MKAVEIKIKGVFLIEPDIFKDSRGWFAESYNKKILQDLGIEADFVQDNHSLTLKKGTIRGLHLQNNPHAQAKLVFCARGAVLDVAVDLRPQSPTYKQWISVELSADNQKQLFIPRGMAHGFITLTDNVEFFYKVDNYYNREAERGIRFNDTELGIDWGIGEPILSDKDNKNPLLKDCEINF